eukprot:m.365326 g.365326  ORF g.365326 m.365326 type:complete len:983 (-) comp30972_c0_seq1:235-3183(-)
MCDRFEVDETRFRIPIDIAYVPWDVNPQTPANELQVPKDIVQGICSKLGRLGWSPSKLDITQPPQSEMITHATRGIPSLVSTNKTLHKARLEMASMSALLGRMVSAEQAIEVLRMESEMELLAQTPGADTAKSQEAFLPKIKQQRAKVGLKGDDTIVAQQQHAHELTTEVTRLANNCIAEAESLKLKVAKTFDETLSKTSIHLFNTASALQEIAHIVIERKIIKLSESFEPVVYATKSPSLTLALYFVDQLRLDDFHKLYESMTKTPLFGERLDSDKLCCHGLLLLLRGAGFWIDAKYDDAMDTLCQAKNRLVEVVGEGHVSVASAFTKLGDTYVNTHKYDDAIECFKQAKDILDKKLGKQHPVTAATICSWANAVTHKGEYTGALTLYKEALDIQEKTLGKTHPSIATTCTGIARVYHCMKQYTFAVSYDERALEISKKMLREDSVTVAMIHNSLALTYKQQGALRGAKKHFEEALNKLQQIFHETHPHIITLKNNFALLWCESRNYDEALKYLNLDKVETATSSFTNCTTTLDIAGKIYREKGDFQQALKHFKSALAVRERVLGIPHAHVASTHCKIAIMFHYLGDGEKALEHYGEALSQRTRTLGERHTDTASTYADMGVVYKTHANYSQSLECLNQALEIRVKLLGKNCPTVACTYESIADVHKQLKELDKAVKLYEEAVRIRLKSDPSDPSIALTYYNIATVYVQKRLLPEALESCENGLAAVASATAGGTAAKIHNEMGNVYDTQGEPYRALEHYQKALTLRVRVHGPEHPETVNLYINIANVYSNMGDFDKALIFHKKGHAIQQSLRRQQQDQIQDTSALETIKEVKGCHGIASLCLRTHEYDEACDWLKKGLALLPPDGSSPDTEGKRHREDQLWQQLQYGLKEAQQGMQILRFAKQDIAGEPTLHQGFGVKRSAVKPGIAIKWQRRWFQLTKSTLYYFDCGVHLKKKKCAIPQTDIADLHVDSSNRIEWPVKL